MKKYVIATKEGNRASCPLNDKVDVDRVIDKLKQGWPSVEWCVFEIEYTAYHGGGAVRGRYDTSKMGENNPVRANLLKGMMMTPGISRYEVV